MTDTDPRIAAADAEAHQRRIAFLSTVALAKDRLTPASLKAEATNTVLDAALDGIEDAKQIARDNPFKVLAFVAALGAIAARRPLWALTRDLWAKGRETYREYSAKFTAEDDHAQQ
ncbi:hypothetical protein [Sphingobium subterraneum]|uniref:Uncharacterized protein n=1 Tax=Sphingobium subterraneum TaxID=627688 RepID=A0A841J1C1_9SPHN|nr:hypothetical protein [Sphingobium subterraneum]MBB6122465.1 hypothetical protein [Sphingobium subterraneum]